MRKGFVFSTEALIIFAVIVILLGFVLLNFPKASSNSFQFETAVLKANDKAIVSFYLGTLSTQTALPTGKNAYCSQYFSYDITAGNAESQLFCSEGGFP